MRARSTFLNLALAVAAPLLLADGAQSRGGHSSGSSSGAADRHPSPSGHSSSGSSHNSGSNSSSGSHGSSGPQTAAQARHPRPGTGSGHGHYGGHSYYPYYSPYYYGYYYPYSFGASVYWGYPYGYGWYGGYYPPYAPYGYSSGSGSLRLLVEPDKARVYVDGYYAGVVDDFDGLFQRLNVAAGRHEVAVKMEGYRSHRVRVYVSPDSTVKIKFDLAKGQGEDPLDDRMSPEDLAREKEENEARRERQRERDSEMAYRPDRRDRDDREDRADRDEGEREPAPSRGRDEQPDVASLRLRIAPEDASIYIDGRFRGTGRQLDDLLLPPGRHRVEVVRPGYRTFDREVEVPEEHELEVALEKL